MKKQKLLLTGFVGFAFLFGCNQIEPTNEVKAGNNIPSGFTILTEDEFDRGNIYTLKNKVTGCHYTCTTSVYNDAYAPDVEQMFIEKDGVSIPYCDKVAE